MTSFDNEYRVMLEQILAEQDAEATSTPVTRHYKAGDNLPPPEPRRQIPKPMMGRVADALVSSFTAPGDVYTGRREPTPEMAAEMALTFTPMAAPARGATIGIGLGGPIRTIADAIRAGNPAAVRRLAPDAIQDGLIRPEEVRHLVGLATKSKNRLYAQGEQGSRLREAGSSDWLTRMGSD